MLDMYLFTYTISEEDNGATEVMRYGEIPIGVNHTKGLLYLTIYQDI